MLLTTIILALLVTFLLQSQLYRFNFKSNIRNELKSRLLKQAEISLQNKEVPVGAVLIYNEKVIGEGYNTILSQNNITGHAEINAINMAYKKFGSDFFKLDRNQLTLYSTYEPCEMCKGVLVQFNIKDVRFEGHKPVTMQIKFTMKSFLYEMRKKTFRGRNMQKKLFLRHPDYPKFQKSI